MIQKLLYLKPTVFDELAEEGVDTDIDTEGGDGDGFVLLEPSLGKGFIDGLFELVEWSLRDDIALHVVIHYLAEQVLVETESLCETMNTIVLLARHVFGDIIAERFGFIDLHGATLHVTQETSCHVLFLLHMIL